MRKLVWLVVAAVVFVSGVVVGQGAKRPYSSFTEALSTGNEFENNPPLWQVGYATGVYDAFGAVVVEVNDFYEALGVLEDEYSPEQVAEAYRFVSHSTVSRVSHTIVDVPVGTSAGQLADVVSKYLEDHPAERHNSAALLAWRAWAEAEWR